MYIKCTPTRSLAGLKLYQTIRFSCVCKAAEDQLVERLGFLLLYFLLWDFSVAEWKACLDFCFLLFYIYLVNGGNEWAWRSCKYLPLLAFYSDGIIIVVTSYHTSVGKNEISACLWVCKPRFQLILWCLSDKLFWT